MTDPILHHYEASPFSEKVRVALGYKGLAWRSVRIPAVMPKPDVIALTGGYRKTPLLQIGPHVFCDTQLIVAVLEQLQPTPALLGNAAAEVIAHWADTTLFDNAVSLAFRPTRFDLMQTMTPEEMGAFLPDRKQMGEGARRFPPAHATARAQLPVFAGRIEGMLRDQPYLMGPAPTVADLSAYHCFWFLRLSCPELLEPFGALLAWMERIAAIGHGSPTALSSADALDIAQNSQPEARFLKPHTVTDLQVDQNVRVRAADQGREPTDGALVFATDNEIAIARHDERAGRVLVHFPRVGYDVIPTA